MSRCWLSHLQIPGYYGHGFRHLGVQPRTSVDGARPIPLVYQAVWTCMDAYRHRIFQLVISGCGFESLAAHPSDLAFRSMSEGPESFQDHAGPKR